MYFLTRDGIVKKPGSSLLDLQKSFLATYNLKTLVLFYQCLSPDCNVEDEKKNYLLLILKVLNKVNSTFELHDLSIKIDSKLGSVIMKKGFNHKSTGVTPKKIDIANCSDCVMMYSVMKHHPGYSKAANVNELVKTFTLKDICRFSR